MRTASLFLPLLMPLLTALNVAAQPAAPPAGSGTNNLFIICTNGVDVSADSAFGVFHGEVRVLDPQMYMECELLTIRFQTNSGGGAPKTADAGLTSADRRIETIVADTNVLIMARNTTILGDQAVYTASNEVMVITGTLVIMENDKSYTYGTNFVFNRKTGTGFAVGPTVVEVKVEGTNNAFKPTFGPARRNSTPTNAPPGPKPK